MQRHKSYDHKTGEVKQKYMGNLRCNGADPLSSMDFIEIVQVFDRVGYLM